ncbi:hypothetical protein QYE76_059203 [Lolium multiflorum]|uniref:Retrotransposon gag domain-containing protein n=1 Tax=Lolium multiflorum TaxID=4521 RepID=A0AAD8V8Q5_LOLMU|nr:hypothetical protein QYE76_059203 [Lolium multiflorum]
MEEDSNHHQASSEESVRPHQRHNNDDQDEGHGRPPPPQQQRNNNEDAQGPQPQPQQRQAHGEERPPPRRNDRNEEEIFGKLKFTMPKFQGEEDPDAYLSWVLKVDKIFRIHNFSEAKKVAMASLEFEGYANVWWEEVNKKREKEDLAPIDTWEEMQEVMHTRFVPTHHKRDLFNKLTQLKQSYKSVEEYYKEMHMTMMSANVDEREEQTMARFLNGLNIPVKRIVEFLPYKNMVELLHQATRAERQVREDLASAKTKTFFAARNAMNASSSIKNTSTLASKDPPKQARSAIKTTSFKPEQSTMSSKASTGSSNITCFKCGDVAPLTNDSTSRPTSPPSGPMTRARVKALHDKVNSLLTSLDLDTPLDGMLPHAETLCVIRYVEHQDHGEDVTPWSREGEEQLSKKMYTELDPKSPEERKEEKTDGRSRTRSDRAPDRATRLRIRSTGRLTGPPGSQPGYQPVPSGQHPGASGPRPVGARSQARSGPGPPGHRPGERKCNPEQSGPDPGQPAARPADPVQTPVNRPHNRPSRSRIRSNRASDRVTQRLLRPRHPAISTTTTTTTTTTIAAPPQGMKTILVLIDHMLAKKTLALTQGEVNSIAMLVLMNDLHKNKLLTKIVIKRLAMPTMGMTTIPKTTSTTTWRHMVMLPPKVVKSNQGVISGIILAMTKGAEGNHNMIKMRGP